VVPVKDLAGTKSRLGPVLNPGARAGLTLYMMGRVVRALHEAGIGDVCVVSPDPIVLNEALGRGATPHLQRSRGLNPALEEGRARALAAAASTLLVLPADLPLLEAGDVRAVLEAAGEGPGVVLSPDGARSGTNALLSRPPDALPFLFGGVRLAVTYCVIGAVVGEWVGSSEGLGFLMIQDKAQFEIPRLFAEISLLSVMGVSLFLLVALLQRLAAPWTLVRDR